MEDMCVSLHAKITYITYVKRSASNMIPCFPAKMCITVTLYHVVPRHPILQKDTLFNTSKSEPGQLQKKYCNSSQDD
jgi:hypothetical protein